MGLSQHGPMGRTLLGLFGMQLQCLGWGWGRAAAFGNLRELLCKDLHLPCWRAAAWPGRGQGYSVLAGLATCGCALCCMRHDRRAAAVSGLGRAGQATCGSCCAVCCLMQELLCNVLPPAGQTRAPCTTAVAATLAVTAVAMLPVCCLLCAPFLGDQVHSTYHSDRAIAGWLCLLVARSSVVSPLFCARSPASGAQH